MAVALLFEGPGITQAQYDQVLGEVSPGNQLPAGALYHVAGPTPNGWRVVEAWESQEAIDRFLAEKLGAALARAGIGIQPQMFQVHNIMQA